MKSTARFAITGALLVCSYLFAWAILPTRADEKPDSATADVKLAVQRVLDDQVAAWNRGDLEGFMAGYWNSPDLTFFSGGDRTSGWQATIERYRKRYQGGGNEMGKVSFSDLQIEPLGPGGAFVRGRWKVVNSKKTVGGLFTLIFKKNADGWRIVHDHTSASDKN
jgi:beta-aspartyl-peptidase (threonine type)